MKDRGLNPESPPEHIYLADPNLMDEIATMGPAFIGLILDEWDDWKTHGLEKPENEDTEDFIAAADKYKEVCLETALQ
jgi:hypothetical protein